MPVIVPPLTSARTLGDLKARIADELARSDLTNQIGLAIEQAIEEACNEHFWFMDTVDISVPLIAGAATYTSDEIGDLISVDRARLFVGTQQRTLREMNDNDRSRLNDGSAPKGEPYAWSRFGDTISVYPIPAQGYTFLLDGVSRGLPLEQDTDSNFWTDTAYGEPFVRALAKRQLYADVIQNVDKALAQDKLAQNYKEKLFELTHSRLALNELEPFGV